MQDATPISVELLGRLMSSHGWTQAVLIVRRDGDDGGEAITTAGATYRDGKVSEEIGKFLTSKVMGWTSDPEADWQKEIDLAKKEMSAGEHGKQLILPTIEKTRGEHITKRGPTGKAKKAWDKLKDTGGFKIK